MNRNPVYRAVAAVLDEMNIPHLLSYGGRHDSVRFSHAGRTFRVIVPKSPSDRRATANARAFIRRLIRQQDQSPT
jgi:hypothetical protein